MVKFITIQMVNPCLGITPGTYREPEDSFLYPALPHFSTIRSIKSSLDLDLNRILFEVRPE